MAELKIPQKTLQDNFNLQDFKDDFNALNSEIAENRSELNSEITNNVNELNSKIDTNKSLTDSEITRLKEIANTWETFRDNGGTIGGTINVNDANLNGSLNFSGILNNTDLKTENKKIFDVKRDTGDQIYFGNGSLRMVLDAKEFNAYGAFNCHSGINIPNYSISSTGYTKLPNGLIMQWGIGKIPMNNEYSSSATFTFPIAFPSSCIFCLSEGHYSRSWLTNSKVIDKSTISIWGFEVNKGTVSVPLDVKWFALGY